jgi:hypothetical protein
VYARSNYSRRTNEKSFCLGREVVQTQVRFLAIGSRMDEAWQLLHHISSSANPLAIKTGLLAYLLSNIHGGLADVAERAKINSIQRSSLR